MYAEYLADAALFLKSAILFCRDESSRGSTLALGLIKFRIGRGNEPAYLQRQNETAAATEGSGRVKLRNNNVNCAESTNSTAENIHQNGG